MDLHPIPRHQYGLIRKVALFLGPLLFIGIGHLGNGDNWFWVVGIAIWMILWWTAEVVPIFITALLPMVLFPMFGIFTVQETFIPYGNPIIFLFMGGFVIALAMEKHNLHNRIALNLMRLTGTAPLGIILGFTLSTAFLSMWISNTATAVMMLPIAMSIIELLKDQCDPNSLDFKRFSLSLMLSIAYSANIGGVMTLIGSPPNVVFAGYFESRYGVEFGFGEWMLIGVPIGLALLFLSNILLTKVIIRFDLKKIVGSEKLFKNKLKELGPMQTGEKLVTIIFVFTALCWTFKSQINQLVFDSNVLNNTSIAMMGALLMLCTPTNLNKGEFLLNWGYIQRLPWGILLLFGGGLSLAAALESVGIIQQIGQLVSENAGSNMLFLLVGLTLFSIFATEIMSNVALVTVFVPVVMVVGDGMGLQPMLLPIAVTIAASCAFMMPISTPPNAVVYSSGHIKMRTMMKVGFVLNLVSIVAIIFVIMTILGD